MISNAFPDVDAFALGIPHATLAVYCPVDAEFPDLGRVGYDSARHGEGGRRGIVCGRNGGNGGGGKGGKLLVKQA